MPSTQAVYYRAPDGTEPVDEFLDGLVDSGGPLAAAKIDAAIEEHLNGQPPEAPPPNFPHSSRIEGQLRELRVRFARTRYRVLYQRSYNLVILLHAFEKNTGQVSDADKQEAIDRMIDYEARMSTSPKAKPRAAGHDAPGKKRLKET